MFELIILLAIIYSIILFIKKNSKPKLYKKKTNSKETQKNETDWPLIPREKQVVPEEQKQDLRYKKKIYFFNKSESAFYRNLVEATKEEYIVLSKVRIADLIEPSYKPYTQLYGKAFNQISRKHVDYVLIDKNQLTIKAAIELDGKSHLKKDRIKSDEVKNYVFKDAELPLIRFLTGTSFSPEIITKILDKEISITNIDTAINTN